MEEHYKDILSRQWKYDFSTLSNNEINFLITNLFYQLFLIDVTAISVSSLQTSSGNSVEFVINGEVNRDMDGLESHEIAEINCAIEKSEEEEEEDDVEDY